MLIEILKPDFAHIDERGALTQLVHAGYNQVNVIFTRSGCRRGRMHYHKLNIEAFYVISGEFRLTCKDVNSDLCEEHILGTGDMFLIPSFIAHDFIFSRDTTLISLYSIGVESASGDKDIYVI